MSGNDHVYLGIKGHAVCIDRRTGAEVWRRKLRMASITNVLLDGDQLLVMASGHLYGLDPRTGDERWHNELPGLGLGAGIIATQGSAASASVVAQMVAAQAAAAAAAG